MKIPALLLPNVRISSYRQFMGKFTGKAFPVGDLMMLGARVGKGGRGGQTD